jgi:hypothetical protein
LEFGGGFGCISQSFHDIKIFSMVNY